MLSWFRARARALSGMALIALAAVVADSVVPHQDDCHDVACGVSLPHDPLDHRVSADPGEGDHTLHCVLCHVTRSFRRQAAPTQLAAALAGRDCTPPVVVPLTSQRHAAAQPPLRAPPLHV